ncbi:sigma-54-dependent transcriptional regulator [Albibacillus kandeliae]|uniref:sigma-54-dependent transcriptional regulator n=1 Tax=Albibacillus kandeliae TaxID=2174228 RepID=UPI000D691CBE|nr:sigma-54 dependent transcriptional regulator [Albibacillus kandeliae]
MTRQVLLVDDDAAVREALSQTLDLAGLAAIPAGSFVAAKDHIAREFQGVILSDIRMPGRDGFHLLNYAHAVDEDLPVVLLTGEGDIPMAVAAMEQGAFDFLEKPCAPADLVAVLERALEARRAVLERRAERMRAEKGDPAARLLFGVSDLAEGLRARVRRLAGMETELLVTGPPGSGISKVAEVIHLSSARSRKPFEKRAADGLDRVALETALAASAGGSLFLDEITRLPPDTQIALIEALDGGTAARVMGGSTADPGPEDMNPDLFYRLEVGTVRVPSIAERPEDIPVLFRHYVAQASEQAGLTPPEITSEHLSALMAQDWPGNTRSLMSAAMRFVLGMPRDVAQASELGLAEQMARVERALLIAALGRQNGHASEAAKALKLPRKTFYDKLARYGIRPEDFRR